MPFQHQARNTTLRSSSQRSMSEKDIKIRDQEFSTAKPKVSPILPQKIHSVWQKDAKRKDKKKKTHVDIAEE